MRIYKTLIIQFIKAKPKEIHDINHQVDLPHFQGQTRSYENKIDVKFI